MPVRVTLLLGLLLLASGAVTAQNVVFRSAVDLVTVDTVVLGRDGRPVSGLGPEDFQIEVDGKRRPVASAQFIAVRPSSPRQAPLSAGYFTSNEHADAGRFIVIAVDEAHIRRLEGRPALQAAARFIDSLDPADRVAVAGLLHTGDIEFSRDRPALKRRLNTLVGQTDPFFLQFNIGLQEAVELADGNRTRLTEVVRRECGRTLNDIASSARADDDAVKSDACPQQVEQEARGIAQHARSQARLSLNALSGLIDTLKRLDGPKTLVLLSEGMIVDPRLIDLGQLAIAARDARVTIYGLHMEAPVFEAAQDRVSPSLLQDTQVRSDGLARIAGAARGAMFRLVGSDPRSFERILEETSAYYLLAFEPTQTDRDGNVHRIDVRLARGGGSVRARPSFRMPGVAPSARTREEELVTLLRSALPVTELPVRVATFVYGEPGTENLRVVVSSEAETPAGSASEVLLGYVLIDGQGVIAASGAERADGGRHAFSARLPPGNYTLRVGGVDPLGRRGLVQRAFTAGLTTQNGLRLSDVILAPVPHGPEAPLAPLIDRTSDTRLSAYLETYVVGAGPLPEIEVRFEIVPADALTPAVTEAGSMTRQGTRWAAARAVLALDALAPGAYLAIARVSDGGVEVARAARRFTLVKH
jgi:VWFA-related protein